MIVHDRTHDLPTRSVSDKDLVLRIARSTQLPALGIRASSDSVSGSEHALPVVLFSPSVELRGRVIALKELRG